MKSQLNEIYSMPMNRRLKDHLINDIGLSDMDKTIIRSLMSFDGDSNFHYENTGIPKEKFERHLRNINHAVFSELLRISNEQFTSK